MQGYALYNLVHSLTSGEKKAVNIYLSRLNKNKGNHLLTLFKKIDKQNTYDEKKLRSISILSKTFRVIKHKLFTEILKVIYLLEIKQAGKYAINNKIQIAGILMGKSMHKEAYKILTKTKKIAVANDYFEALLQILEMQRLISYANRDIDSTDKCFLEKKIFINKLNNLHQYKHLNYRINKVLSPQKNSSTISIKNEIRDIINNPLMKKDSNALSYSAKHIFCDIKMAYYTALRNKEKCFQFGIKRIELFESNLNYIKYHFNDYLTSINNMIYSCERFEDNKIAYQYILKYKDAPKYMGNILSHKSKEQILNISIFYQLSFLFNCGEFNKAFLLAKDTIEKNKASKFYLEKKLLSGYYYILSIIFFAVSEFEEALVWCNKILNNPNIIILKELNTTMELLNLVIHYELGNEFLINHYSTNFYNKLSKKFKNKKSFELLFLNYFKNLKLDNHHADENNDNLKKLKKEVLELSQSTSTKEVLGYFSFLVWIDAKISNKPFSELLKRKIEK